MSYKFAIVMRTDLDMRKGKMCSQAGHAVGSLMYCAIMDLNLREKIFRWFREGNQTKVVLKVSSKQELYEIIQKAHSLSVPSFPVHDAGKTQIDPGTLTCVGIGPDTNENIDAIVGRLKLL